MDIKQQRINEIKEKGFIEPVIDYPTIENSNQECRKCEYLIELYESTEKSNRDYWLMTELFVMLHGSDECREK